MNKPLSVKVINTIFFIKISFLFLSTSVPFTFYIIRNNPNTVLNSFMEGLLNAGRYGVTNNAHNVAYAVGSLAPVILITCLILYGIKNKKFVLLKICILLNILLSAANVASIIIAALIAMVVFTNKKLQKYMVCSEVLHVSN